MIQDIRQYSRQMVRELDLLKGFFQDSGCTFSQCHALLEIDRKGVLNLMELAEELLLDKSTTSRLVKGLTEKGLVRVEKKERDQRQKWYSLTEKGRKQLATNDQRADARAMKAISLLEGKERQSVVEGLRLYSKALRQSRLQAPFEIRLIRREDNPEVARIIREVMTEFGAVGKGYSIQDPEVDQMYEVYTNARSAFFVISKEEEIMGCGGIAPLTGGEADTCELRKMYFRPELRGLGLGKRLATVCLETARERGYKKCYLETLERMWQANQLYQKMGFRKLGAPEGHTGHSSCDCWYMKSLV